MSYATEPIANTLKAARKNKGLSQRELSKKTGVPQGHISKIENGIVDLRLSSLVELARVLDLELTLVPRKTVPAVQSIVRSSSHSVPSNGKIVRQARKEFARLTVSINRLPTDLLPGNELEQLQRQARELQHFQLSQSDIEIIRDAHRSIKEFMNNPENINAIRRSLSRLRELRNALAHRGVDAERVGVAGPAYSLDEDDDG